MRSTDFLQNNRFKDYLVGTKMYRELYFSKEGIASIAFSSVVTIYLTCMVENISESHLREYLLTLLGIILGGGF